ncbi:asparagine synthase-related protein [Phenylobacterium sp. J426]|uniref:asparagine synthase-related protein n=1 Tax=Phenylobacterium sp. J426 TaxID=2898439 RepID=UPI0035B05F1C
MSSEGPEYLAFAWPAEAAEASAQAARWREWLQTAEGWRPLHFEPGLEVWSGRRRALDVTPWAGGVVLGGLRSSRARLPGLARAKGPWQAARSLCDVCWGRYVALIRRPGEAPMVFRDPSGSLDAATWRSGALVAVASDVAGLPPSFAPHDLALDWDAITDFVRRPLTAVDRCGLIGYHTVAPGALQPMGRDAAAAEAVWRPQDHAGNTAIPEAEARLRDEVLRCAGLVLDDGPALVEVSGGLDSAIVAAALATAERRAELTGLNYYGDRPEGDERGWARSVCASAGLPLIEHPKTIVPVAEADFDAFATGLRPAFNALDPDRDRHTADVAAGLGASAIFTGSGGDALFFQHPTPLVVADYRRAHGRLSWTDPFAADVARWLRRSIWSVRRGARARRRGDGPGSVLWGPRTREPVTRAAHPWLTDIGGLPPAKQIQIELIAAAQAASGVSRRATAADLRHPLLSQPIVELCLAIPTWSHVADGRDRGLVREAFAGRLPDAVLQRRSKGALTSLYTRRAATSLDFLRPYLLDGVLANAGVLDRAALDAALDVDRLIWRADGARVMGAAMVEAWVRHWQTHAPDAAHAARRRRPPSLA